MLRPLSNPPNPWASTETEYFDEIPRAKLEIYEDQTREILSRNNSPDLGFRFSINPYRGCFHGCAYCYARPSHEYLGFGAGTDFERKLVVKLRAAELLRAAFDKHSWCGETVMMSGITDCYQPIEAVYRLTRACVEVCKEYRNPLSIITKAPLIERDLDLLAEMATQCPLTVTISIPLWDETKARALEPFVATPQRRMRTLARLAAMGIAVGINIAPLVPGLGEADIPILLEEAKRAGARYAGLVFLRLPGSVKAVFTERLQEGIPLRAEKILRQVRRANGDKLYDSRFFVRGSGQGLYAQSIHELFSKTARRLGLLPERIDLAPSNTFARPSRPATTRQLPLF